MAADLAEAGGAGTGVVLSAGQTQVGAASVVVPTAIFPCRLALGVQGVDVHGEVEFVANDLLVLASKFVGTIDALGVPVCPVQAVFKHRDGKGMREALANDSLAVTPVQIGPLNDVVLSVHPVHTAPGIIDGEAVGPEEMGISDDAAARAIHAGGLDAGGVAPVCPVNGPLHGVQGNGPGLLQVLPQQHLPVGPVQVGHLNP